MVEQFTNKLDPEKFRSTNGPWNSLMLNDPWSVGYVTTLIELKNFSSRDEWEELYYKTGAYRDKLLEDLNQEDREFLNDETLIRTKPEKVNRTSWDLKNINYHHGRTRKQIRNKGKILWIKMQSLKSIISLEECIECVRYRTICETWNGVIVREKNTIEKLNKISPDLKILKTLGDFDFKYAVDYQLYNGKQLICGIQIKPISYHKGSAIYLLKAKKANQRKNNEYEKDFNKPVFYLYSKASGNIINEDVLIKIKSLV